MNIHLPPKWVTTSMPLTHLRATFSALLILVGMTASIAQPDCSSISENISGFIYMGEFNGSKYFCSNSNKKWNDAVNLVQSKGGQLAIVSSAAENQFLKNNMIGSTAWIGYSDENNEGSFQWQDGSTHNYDNWSSGEPNNVDPNYSNGADYAVILKSDGKWRDRHHKNKYEVIMEIECSTSCTPNTVVKWDLDACTSYSNNGSNLSYDEFTPTYPSNSSCSSNSVAASLVYRNQGGHSCTYPRTGASGEAMCVGSSSASNFSNDDPLAVRFEVTLTTDDVGMLSSLNFWQAAPFVFDWIDGISGQNNYPTKYGIRVLKDGNEIYKQIDIPASNSWTLEEYDFPERPDFKFTNTAVFSFELLAYAPIGNSSNVQAWDLDNISIEATCCLDVQLASLGDYTFIDDNRDGFNNAGDTPLPGVKVYLYKSSDLTTPLAYTVTDANGFYEFIHLDPDLDYVVQFVQPADYSITTQTGSASIRLNDNSDPNEITGFTDAVDLMPGENNPTVDAGFFLTSVLPVDLLGFKAHLINNQEVLLKWSTASEENNKHFVVEHSYDGREFKAIGIVEGQGTTSTVHHYQLKDLNPLHGNNYYRLRQIDHDGSYEFSNIETVLISHDDMPNVFVYPNPTIKSTTIKVLTPLEADAEIQVIHHTGKLLNTYAFPQGSVSQQLNLQDYAPGVYFILVKYNGQKTNAIKVIKLED